MQKDLVFVGGNTTTSNLEPIRLDFSQPLCCPDQSLLHELRREVKSSKTTEQSSCEGFSALRMK